MILSALNKKNFVKFRQLRKSYKRSCWPTLSRQYAFGVCRCIWVQATWLWCRGNFTPTPNSPQSDLRRQADSTHVGLCPKFLVNIFISLLNNKFTECLNYCFVQIDLAEICSLMSTFWLWCVYLSVFLWIIWLSFCICDYLCIKMGTVYR